MGKGMNQQFFLILTTIIIGAFFIIAPNNGQAFESIADIRQAGIYQPVQPCVLYGVTFAGNKLLAIDSETAETTVIGTTVRRGKFNGLSRIEDSYYIFNQYGNKIIEIDVIDGSVVNEFLTNINNIYAGEGAIAFDSSGTGYAVMGNESDDVNDSPQMYTFNIADESSNLIGELSGWPRSCDGLAFDENDVLYGLSQTGRYLTIIDINTGEVEPVGPTDIDIDRSIESIQSEGTGVGGIVIIPDGRLFAIIGPYLYQINKVTGKATFIGDTGHTWISGLEFGYYIEENEEELEPGTFGDLEEPKIDYYIPPKDPYMPDLLHTVDPTRTYYP